MDELAREIAEVHARRGDPTALHAALRRARLLVAMVDDHTVAALPDRGLHWLCGFTDLLALARFGRARDGGDRPWIFRTVRGAELIDRWVPAAIARAGAPVGVAVDLAGARPMVFPPLIRAR